MTLAERLRDSRFLRFAIVGTGGFLVDETVLALVTKLFGMGALGGRAVSIVTAMTFTWWGNRNLTFRGHAAVGVAATAREWLRFAAANSIGASINYGTYALLVRFAPAPLNNAFLDVLIGVGVGLIFNFTLSKKLVFRVPTDPV